MSFLSGLRGMTVGKPELDGRWNVPETTDDMEPVFQPDSGTHLIYKHSGSCGGCIFAKARVEAAIDELSGMVNLHFIEVRQNRVLSGFIEEKSGVRHESPQLLLIRNGRVLWYGSHSAVAPGPVLEILKEIA